MMSRLRVPSHEVGLSWRCNSRLEVTPKPPPRARRELLPIHVLLSALCRLSGTRVGGLRAHMEEGRACSRKHLIHMQVAFVPT